MFVVSKGKGYSVDCLKGVGVAGVCVGDSMWSVKRGFKFMLSLSAPKDPVSFGEYLKSCFVFGENCPSEVVGDLGGSLWRSGHLVEFGYHVGSEHVGFNLLVGSRFADVGSCNALRGRRGLPGIGGSGSGCGVTGAGEPLDLFRCRGAGCSESGDRVGAEVGLANEAGGSGQEIETVGVRGLFVVVVVADIVVAVEFGGFEGELVAVVQTWIDIDRTRKRG